MCKKVVSPPQYDRNYNTVKRLHVCRKCMLATKRDFQDKSEAETKAYDFLVKKEEFVSTVERKCSR